jgi:hypothetical protein
VLGHTLNGLKNLIDEYYASIGVIKPDDENETTKRATIYNGLATTSYSDRCNIILHKWKNGNYGRKENPLGLRSILINKTPTHYQEALLDKKELEKCAETIPCSLLFRKLSKGKQFEQFGAIESLCVTGFSFNASFDYVVGIILVPRKKVYGLKLNNEYLEILLVNPVIEKVSDEERTTLMHFFNHNPNRDPDRSVPNETPFSYEFYIYKNDYPNEINNYEYSTFPNESDSMRYS